MDSFYGPVRFKGDDKLNNFDKARNIIADGPTLDGGEHSVNPRGAIATLANHRNFTPEAVLARQSASPKKWTYSDHFEPTKIFQFTKQQPDFQTLSRDFRGLEANGWLLDTVIDEELDRIELAADGLDVSIMRMTGTLLLGDSRFEVSQGFLLSEDFLSKRFWVFPQGNYQAARPKHSGSDITIHTLEGANDGESSLVITFKTISENLGTFTSQIRDFMTKRDKDKEIWWSLRNPATSTMAKYSLPGSQFRWSQFSPYLGFSDSGQNQHIWVGTAGSEYIVPIRPTQKVEQSPNSHWWVTIVDSVTGEAYIHDSLRGVSSTRKTTKLIENLNWLLETLPPNLKGILPQIRRSGKAPFTPIYAPVQFTASTQQKNSSDCGAFLLGNVAGFVERLKQGQDDNDGLLQSNFIPKEWTALALRKRLRNLKRVVRLLLPPSPKLTH